LCTGLTAFEAYWEYPEVENNKVKTMENVIAFTKGFMVIDFN
jgi:hypothetical protein